jgi:hypothetical protein
MLVLEVEVKLRPTANRPVYPGAELPSETHDQIFSLYWQLRVSYCGRPIWREDGSVIYSFNCFWALPEQSLSGPSPAELTTIFHCLMILPQPEGPGPRIYIPQEQDGPVIPLDTGFPFRRLLRLSGLQWRYSNLPSHALCWYCTPQEPYVAYFMLNLNKYLKLWSKILETVVT